MARNEAVTSTIEMFTKRVFYREEEIEKILQEQYRVSREKQGARDTNVTQSVRSMKGEVQQQLDHERTRDQMINVELLMQLWPNMGELIMHLVRITAFYFRSMHCTLRKTVLRYLLSFFNKMVADASDFAKERQ